MTNSRDETIKAIRTALKARSGKTWSVTGGRGTAWGWISIDAPPARRTGYSVQKPGTAGHDAADWDRGVDNGVPGGSITAADRAELATLLGLDSIYDGGVSIPASSAHYAEYVARAKGLPATVTPAYWD